MITEKKRFDEFIHADGSIDAWMSLDTFALSELIEVYEAEYIDTLFSHDAVHYYWRIHEE